MPYCLKAASQGSVVISPEIFTDDWLYRWEAGKAQIWTASVGMLGALAALSLDSVHSMEVRTSWILPFSAGGFLNIGNKWNNRSSKQSLIASLQP